MVKPKHCYICGKEVEIKGSMKDHQNEVHKEDLAKIKISNTMEDVVRTFCKVFNKETNKPCGEKLKVTMMRGHTKKAHNMIITDYKKEYNQHYYDLIELILHKCGICEEYVLLDSDEIAKHLKMKTPVNHDITHGNYNAKFMKLAGPSGSRPKNPSAIPMVNNAVSGKVSKEIQPETKTMINPKETVASNPENRSVPSKFPHGVSKAKLNKKKPNHKPKPTESLKESVTFSSEDTERSDGELLLQEPDPSVTVGSFRALLDCLSDDSEHLRFPDLEMILNLNI